MLPATENRSFNRGFLAIAVIWLVGMITIALVQGVQTGTGTGLGDGRVLVGRYGAPPAAGVDDRAVLPDPNPPVGDPVDTDDEGAQP